MLAMEDKCAEYIKALHSYMSSPTYRINGRLFDFRRYNLKKRSEAAEGAGLSHIALYIACFVEG